MNFKILPLVKLQKQQNKKGTYKVLVMINQDLLNKLNELSEKLLAIKEVYQKLSKVATAKELQNYFAKREDDFESFSKNMIQLIYKLGGKYEENKNLTEENSTDLSSILFSKEIKNTSDEILIKETKHITEKIIEAYKAIISNKELSQKDTDLLKSQLDELQLLLN